MKAIEIINCSKKGNWHSNKTGEWFPLHSEFWQYLMSVKNSFTQYTIILTVNTCVNVGPIQMVTGN